MQLTAAQLRVLQAINNMQLPEWVRYVAQDSYGDIIGYRNHPDIYVQVDGGFWIPSEVPPPDSVFYVTEDIPESGCYHDWHESLLDLHKLIEGAS